MNPETRNDLTGGVVVVLIIGVLTVGSHWTLLPFQGALSWATTIVVATWPLLLRIQRRVDLPLILIFAGVIGGMVAFGVIGLFIGPVVLTVTYTLLQSWTSDSKAGAR